MSNVTMSSQGTPSTASEVATDNASEQAAITYMAFWMTVGTMAGAYLGFLELSRAPGTYLPAVILISATAGAVVGAAIGQLIGGLLHVIARKALD